MQGLNANYYGPMVCGACGCKMFRVDQDGSAIHLFCTQCEALTIITVSQPQIMLKWGPKSDGIICPSG